MSEPFGRAVAVALWVRKALSLFFGVDASPRRYGLLADAQVHRALHLLLRIEVDYAFLEEPYPEHLEIELAKLFFGYSALADFKGFVVHGLDEVHVGRGVLELPEIAVDLVHPAVLAARCRIEFLVNELHDLFTPHALPNLLEGAFVYVADEESLVAEEGAACPYAAP